MHLDLETDDIEAEVQRLEALGAASDPVGEMRFATVAEVAALADTWSSTCAPRTPAERRLDTVVPAARWRPTGRAGTPHRRLAVGQPPAARAHLVGLGAGFLLQRLAPWMPPLPAWTGRDVGLPLVLAGLWLAAWAVRAAAGMALGRPDRLVRGGPYAFSRNPMYLAWTLGYAGIALAAGAAWPLLLLPVVLLATHLVVVVVEERALERRFGDAYRRYAASVRRYL